MIAAGDGGIGPPVLFRARRFTGGPRDHPQVTEVGKWCRRRDSNPQVHRLSTCCVYHFRHAGIWGPPERTRSLVAEILIARGAVKNDHPASSTA